jgi:hypothetical protein
MQYESAEKENSRSLVSLQGAGRQTPRVLPPQGDICLDIFFYRTGMFANRDSYVMTEEEIAEYEKSEREQQGKKRKKSPANY